MKNLFMVIVIVVAVFFVLSFVASFAGDLVYSTYLGGSSEDRGSSIALDSSGNAYISGVTISTNFPTTPGAFDTSLNTPWDVFVSKVDSTGTVLLYSTYLGGGASDLGRGIAVDTSGNAFITGMTNSADFPTTPGAFDTSLNGSVDVFVSKLNASGTALVYSTYLGGAISNDDGYGIAIDSSGNTYITGYTSSADFPTTPGAFDTSFNGGSYDVFVTKLNVSGTALVYSTYLGGGSYDYGNGIAIDSSGNTYITGYTSSADFPTTPGAFDTSFNGGSADVYVSKLNPSGTALVYSTYLGGAFDDRGFSLDIDSSGNTYITGYTVSTDFPTTAGAFDTSYSGNYGGPADVFVTKLYSTGTALVYSTYLGGGGDELGYGITIDRSGNAYITGYTYSTNFPTTPGAFDTSFNGGYADVFVSKLNSSGTALAYSTYLGGAGDDRGFSLDIDSLGNAYLAGWAGSSDFPTTVGAFDTSYNGGTYDVFVSKLILNHQPNTVTLLQPGNSVPIHTNILAFSWSTATDPDSDTPIQYQLQVDNDSTFSSPDFALGFSSATSATPGIALPPNIYYWRVISQDPFFAQNTSTTYWCIAYDSTQSRNHSLGSPSLIYYLGTLGASTDYTPMILSVNTVVGTDTVTISVFDTKHPNAIDSTGKLGNQYFSSRWWNITNTGGISSANIRFTYTDEDFSDASFGARLESQIELAKYSSGSWSWYPASARDTTENWVQVDGVTSFSAWALSGPGGVPAELSRFETEYCLYPPKE